MDAFILSRIQFGFTIAFHIIFPAFTIGLASYLAVLEGLWLYTRREAFKNLYLFWVKVFAIAFGMGVVSGVVMSYQFGTNWSVFIAKTGNVIGPLLAFEVLTAFFLEASFLGVMLFGWKKVGPKLHFAATALVALGTATSAFWILSANSWMHTPAGFATLADGRLIATDYLQVIFNPSFPSRFAHMLLAAYITTGLVVMAASAWQYLRGRASEESRIALRMAVLLVGVLMPLQILAGHESGVVAEEYQPAKVAAMEGWWEDAPTRGTILFAWPDEDNERNRFALEIPDTSRFLFTPEAELKGLKDFAPEDRPPVGIVFWGFRIMVGLGLGMLATGALGLWLWATRRLDRAKWFHWLAVLMGPSGFAAVLAGWVTTEVGRQPYIAYGVLRTAEALSPVSAGQVATSLAFFFIVYAIVFSVGVLYILRLLRAGPQSEHGVPSAPDRGPNTTFAGAPLGGPEPAAAADRGKRWIWC